MDLLLGDIFHLLSRHNTTLSSVISHILIACDPSPSVTASILLDDLIAASPDILSAFNQHPISQNVVHHIAKQTYLSEIKDLTDKENPDCMFPNLDEIGRLINATVRYVY